MARAAIDRSFHRQDAGRNEMSARPGKQHFGAMQQAAREPRRITQPEAAPE
jgi:hypothetical protein